MSEWQDLRFGDVAALSNGTNFTKESFGKGLKILGVRDFGDRTVPDWAGMDEVRATALTSDRQLLADGDLVFVRSNGNPALVGRSMLVTPGPEATHSAFTIKARPNQDIVIPRFLAYQMRNAHRAGLMRAANGTNIANLSQTILAAVPVRIPSRATQLKVLDVLGSIDDLIENNRRRVEVLEGMARTIYREWFVNFRYPGHQDVALVDSSVGPLPDGWQPRTVSDVAAVVVRGISPKYAEDGDWVVLNQKCIRDGRVSFGQSRRQERAVSDAKRIRFGDVLINSTGVGTLGRVAMYRGPSEGVTVDSHVTIARPAEESFNPWFALNMLAKQGEIERMGTGATGQTELRKADVEALDLIQPPPPVIDGFAQTVSPLLEQVDVLIADNETLSTLRDLLLPKLVTGQIDVSSLDLDALNGQQVA